MDILIKSFIFYIVINLLMFAPMLRHYNTLQDAWEDCFPKRKEDLTFGDILSWIGFAPNVLLLFILLNLSKGIVSLVNWKPFEKKVIEKNIE